MSYIAQANTCREAEYSLDVCSASNGAHTDIEWTRKKLRDIQCLKMCRVLQNNMT